jgi:hypothetical protein
MAGAFLAERAKQPLLALSPDESDKIANAAANVAKHYDIPISPLTQAWLALAGTVGAIYFSKIAVIRAASAMQKETPVAMAA